MKNFNQSALVLTGGGARGAYQAGVIHALATIAKSRNVQLPFGIVTGTSAGAINGSYVAAHADRFFDASGELVEFWGGLHSRDVFRTDAVSLGRIAYKWVSDVVLGRMKSGKGARALLDTSPLQKLLATHIPFEKISSHIQRGTLTAFEVAATDYHSSENISFVMAHDQQPEWVRSKRRSMPTQIQLEHVMASAAIPLFFPPVEVAGRHYGDGCLRNPAPLSPAIRLGAQRLLLVGVKFPKPREALDATPQMRPTIGRVLSTLLNAVLMDAVEFDIERLTRINRTIAAVPESHRQSLGLRPIDICVLQPSQDLGAYAATQFRNLPDSMRHLIGGLGSNQEVSEILSYLLFEPEYCRYLADLGRRDTMQRQDEIASFLF